MTSRSTPALESQNSDKSLFDIENPYGSICKFSGNQLILLSSYKRKFLAYLESFFRNMAYSDQAMPADRVSDFISSDFSAIESAAKQVGFEGETFRYLQLIATIAKASKLSFEQLNIKHVCAIAVFKNSESEEPLCWGWIPREFVNQSPGLRQRFVEHKGQVVINNESIKPSVLFAMQRFVEFIKTGSTRLDLSCEALCDLIVFAHKWNVKPLRLSLKDFLEKLPEHEEAKFAATYERCANETLKEAIQALNIEPKRQKEKPYSIEDGEDSSEESLFFDPQSPYDSLIRFAGRCCTLPVEEQNRFFATVSNHFTLLAYSDERQEIPEPSQKRFALIALPFLLATRRPVKVDKYPIEFERHRQLACIMLVASARFPQLSPKDQLVIEKTPYGTGSRMRMRISWKQAEISGSSSHYIAPLEIVEAEQESELDTILAQALVDSSSMKQLKELLTDGTTQTETSTQLVKRLKRENTQLVLSEISLSLLNPDLERLSVDDLYQLFVFAISHKKLPFKEATTTYLEPTSHRNAVFKKYESETTLENRKGEVFEYFSWLFIEITRRGLPYHLSEFPTLVAEAIQNRSLAKAIKAEFVTSLRSTFHSEKAPRWHSSDIERLYQKLHDKKMISLCEKREPFTTIRAELIEALIQEKPGALISCIADQFIEKFFPERIGQDSFKAMIGNCIRKGLSLKGEKEQKLDLDIKSLFDIYNILESENVRNWLVVTVKKLSHFNFSNEFNYKHELFSLKNLLPLVDIAGHEKAASLEMKFLQLILLGHNHRSFKDLHERFTLWQDCFKTIIKINISSEQLDWLEGFLKQDKVKEACESCDIKHLYPPLVRFLERRERAIRLADKFVELFNLPNDESSLAHDILNIFRMVYINQGIDFSIGHVWDPVAIQLAQVLKNPDATLWLKENAGDFMPEALYCTLEKRADNLPILLEVNAFFTRAKEKGYSRLLGFESILQEIGRSKEPIGDKKIEDFLETIRIFKQQQELIKILYDEELRGLLRSENLKNVPDLLLGMPSLKAAMKQEGCIIS